MNAMRQRAKDQMPAMLLTLMSIVQALALELLWAKIMSAGTLHVWSLGSISGWLQVAATFNGVVLVWVLYVNNIMRFRWVPSTVDSVAPFFVGLLQFSLISSIGPAGVGKWLMVLALVFAIMPLLIHRTMRASRLDEDNAEFFQSRPPATWRDFIGNGVISAGLFAVGFWIELTGYRGVWVVLALAVSWLLMLLNLYLAHRFWQTTVIEQSSG